MTEECGLLTISSVNFSDYIKMGCNFSKNSRSLQGVISPIIELNGNNASQIQEIQKLLLKKVIRYNIRSKSSLNTIPEDFPNLEDSTN